MKLLGTLLSGVIAVSLVGCGGGVKGPQLSESIGAVTYKGKLLPQAQVVFTPAVGPMAIGETNEKGEFKLSTQGKPGAIIGQHRVTIQAVKIDSKAAKLNEDNDNTYVPVTSLIPVRYGVLGQSELTGIVDVESSKNRFLFDLK